MKKRPEKGSKEKGHSVVEEEPVQPAVPNIQEKCPVQSIDDYQCTGNVEVDFPELCAILGLKKVPDVRPLIAHSAERAKDSSQEQILSEGCTVTWSPKPCLQIEKENEDARSVKRIRISGWRVDEVIAQVLSKMLPSLSNLQTLQMWRVGLTDSILTSLKNTISMCSKLRRVILEGTPIPENSYHILMGEDSMISHLSLRNNRIGEDGARLIGLALSKNLRSLSLAFNAIGDAGAIHIAQGLCHNHTLLNLSLANNHIGDVGAAQVAQGLRLNHTLLHLSLANNHIGDVGAAQLAQVLGPFALTHEEIVERRRELKRKDQLDATKKDEKHQTVIATGKKEDPKVEKKKTSDMKMPQGRGAKSDAKDMHSSMKEQEAEDVGETQSPLLNPDIQSIGGKVIYPGNTTLLFLNLSGNKLTQQSLQMFLRSLECQGKEGLQYISLNRNSFPLDCEAFLKLQEMMSLKDPLNRTASAQVEPEHGQAA
ncbi:leucine-rich repeat-containing protein 71 [Clarias gariepinus]|uniref:leucine-rich repeat-containing protein 71 n=1 Tax=Clarias gariepinus TaxID=13013 RepID=UPI00234D0247|nr:leucine-rich repeat-containing protein 71 [Clarias gariepinus]